MSRRAAAAPAPSAGGQAMSGSSRGHGYGAHRPHPGRTLRPHCQSCVHTACFSSVAIWPDLVTGQPTLSIQCDMLGLVGRRRAIRPARSRESAAHPRCQRQRQQGKTAPPPSPMLPRMASTIHPPMPAATAIPRLNAVKLSEIASGTDVGASSALWLQWQSRSPNNIPAHRRPPAGATNRNSPGSNAAPRTAPASQSSRASTARSPACVQTGPQPPRREARPHGANAIRQQHKGHRLRASPLGLITAPD